MKRSLLLPVAAVLLAGSAACQSRPDTTGQRTDGFAAPSREIVYDVAVQTLQQEGFSPDPDESAPEQGLVVTRWYLSLQPFSGMGHRQQATVRIHEVPGRPNWFVVEANVLRQPNDNLTQPSNPIIAEWGDATRVPELEHLITGKIERYFIGADVSARFRERYGMPAGPETRLAAPKLAGDR